MSGTVSRRVARANGSLEPLRASRVPCHLCRAAAEHSPAMHHDALAMEKRLAEKGEYLGALDKRTMRAIRTVIL